MLKTKLSKEVTSGVEKMIKVLCRLRHEETLHSIIVRPGPVDIQQARIGNIGPAAPFQGLSWV